MTRIGVRWAAVGIVAATILVASTLPLDPTPPLSGSIGPIGVDAWLHAAGFAALAVTLWIALTATRPATAATATAVLIVGVAYGAGIEILQAGIPTRTFEVADAVGTALGVPIWRLAAALRRRSGPPAP